MLKLIGGSFLKDIIGLVKTHPELFKKEASARMSDIESALGSNYPKSLLSYVASMTQEGLMKQLSNTLDVLQGQAFAQEENQILQAIAHFISEEFGQQLDQLDHLYFAQGVGKKLTIIEEKITGPSHLEAAMRCLLSEQTYQELTQQAHHALHRLKEIPTALIQSPVELNSELRQGIRAHFLKKYPFSFVEFQTNPQIIGGMRVFVDGAVVDHSWLAKIQAITQLQF